MSCRALSSNRESKIMMLVRGSLREPLTKSSAERVAGKIGMITRHTTPVVAWSTMPRSVTQWRPKASTEGPRGAGIGQRWAPRPRDYISLGRSHPATGSHLPMEGTAPPSAVAPHFTATQTGRGFAIGLLCQAPREGDTPFPSSPFAHPIPQSPRRARVGFVQRFPKHRHD